MPTFAVKYKNYPMKDRIIILILPIFILACFSFDSSAQDNSNYSKPKKQFNLLDRLDFGGYLGAQFGTVIVVDIAPMVSYRVTDNFYVGLGGTYQYYKDKRYYPDYSSSAYGANLFARYFIWRDLFAHIEYAPLYVNYYDYYFDNSGNYSYRVKSATWVHDFMLGGGYRQWIGNKAFLTLMILWNVNESYYSPYRNPIIKIGFGAGI